MHTFIRGKVFRIMPKRYDEEFKARAVRLVADHCGEYDSQWACIQAGALRLGVSPETLRRWVREGERGGGQHEVVASDVVQENRELKRKNRELEETIEILKAATSFFARESDPRRR
jgi:transposase